MHFIKTPLLLKKLYPGLLWDAPTADRCIYLTFDDGPIPIVTPYVLNILHEYDAKATFFCIGDNINKHPEVFEQVKNAGHSIGDHTYNHLKGWDTDDQVYLENYKKANELTGSKLFRPPYGRIKRSQVKLLKDANPDIQIVMWNVLSADYDTRLTPQKCLDNVIRHTKAGDIVLFHDSLKARERLEYALPRAMKYWTEKGFTFKALI